MKNLLAQVLIEKEINQCETLKNVDWVQEYMDQIHNHLDNLTTTMNTPCKMVVVDEHSVHENHIHNTSDAMVHAQGE